MSNLVQNLIETKLEDLTFSIVDTETTGMNPVYSRVIDVGIVRMKAGEILETWESLVDPEQEVPHWITFYTHLTTKDVKGKALFGSISSNISNLLAQSIFVGHNVHFDYSFLQSEMLRVKSSFFYPKLCTVNLSRKLLPHLQNVHLDALSDYFGIKIENRHRALPDALATAEVLNRLINIGKEKFNIKNFFDLDKLQKLSIPSENNVNLKYGEPLIK